MLGRRSFLIACGLAVTAPAVAKSLPLLATCSRLPLQTVLEETYEAPVLRIEEWDTPVVSKETAHSQMWISVNRSWRALSVRL
jgi:hypothetical protein